MNNYCVYKIIFPNSKLYFGITNNFERRKKQHKKESKKSNIKLYRALRKHGLQNCIFEVIQKDLSVDDARKMEIAFIAESNSVKNGYNSSFGGQISPILNEEVKRKILRKIQTAEHRERVSKKMKQLFHGDAEVRKKRSITSKASWEKNRQSRVAAMRLVQKMPEHIEKMKLARKKAWESKERRQKCSERTRIRMGAIGGKNNMNTPSSIEKRNATKRTPEWRMAQSMRLKEFYKKKCDESIEAGLACPAEVKAERAAARARIVR